MSKIQDAVNEIKKLIEDAIKTGGVTGKNNLIRSQRPICLLHDAVKTAFIEANVDSDAIRPRYNSHAGEMKLAGFFKFKDQDVCVLPEKLKPKREILNFDGILKGMIDEYGKAYTEHTLSVNVRSQLSSSAKNFDTLYERTFAEALNLHLRCPKIVLGELYMIPVSEYDTDAARKKEVAFKTNTHIQEHIQKYIHSFSAINNRKHICSEKYKYERVCLLIVDFNKDQPKIYNTDEELKTDGLLPSDSTASIKDMNFNTFVTSLLKTYRRRFYHVI